MDKYIDDALKTSIAVKTATVSSERGKIKEFVQLIAETLSKGNKLLICGNGGSAADSIHIAGEFTNRLLKERKPLAAVSLTADIASMTAIANDYSFEEIFSKQVAAIGRPGDILWLLTTSGNSQNLINAAKVAKDIGIKIVAFSGKDGGQLVGDCDISIIAREGKNSPRIQETHLFLYHLVIELLDELMLGDIGA